MPNTIGDVLRASATSARRSLNQTTNSEFFVRMGVRFDPLSSQTDKTITSVAQSGARNLMQIRCAGSVKAQSISRIRLYLVPSKMARDPACRNPLKIRAGELYVLLTPSRIER